MGWNDRDAGFKVLQLHLITMSGCLRFILSFSKIMSKSGAYPHVSTISTLEMLPPGFIHDLRARVFVQFDQGVVVLQDDPVMDGEVSTNGSFHVLGSQIIQFWSKEKWIQFWMPSTHNRNCFRSLAFCEIQDMPASLHSSNRPSASTSMDILQQTPLSE